MRIQPKFILGLLLGALCISILCSLAWGAMSIAPLDVLKIIGSKLGFSNLNDITAAEVHVLWNIRLPRTLAAIFIGAGLSIAGAAIQGLFRNPLADPGLVGISSGASLAAAIAILLGISTSGLGNIVLGTSALSLFAFIGAAITAIIVYRLSTVEGKTQISTMLLAGVAINALTMAGVGFITNLADESQLRDITFWMLGSLGGISWSSLVFVFPITVLVLIFLPRLGGGLNGFALGEENAAYLGINVKRMKWQVLLFSTLAVGIAVAVSGVIGFVGLVIPHLIRLLIGPDNKLVLPFSMLGGAILLTTADLLSRTISAPTELPIGILTAVVGTPLFLSILLREKRKFSLS